MPLAFDLGYFAKGLLPEVGDPTAVPEVDLIVVLTGGQGRLREALSFLNQGKGHSLFVSGTAPRTQLLDILKANNFESLSDELRGRILLGDESRSTEENAQEVRRAVETLKANSALLVTSTYHMRRARLLLENELAKAPEYAVRIYSYPVESPNFDRLRWWRTFTGWRILFSEYLKSWALRLN
jgi:uncharacterized SAM-binding protein YcdF (DUF218 family)